MNVVIDNIIVDVQNQPTVIRRPAMKYWAQMRKGGGNDKTYTRNFYVIQSEQCLLYDCSLYSGRVTICYHCSLIYNGVLTPIYSDMCL